jgi:hypothetical protein
LACLPLDKPGVWYARTFLHSPSERDARLGVPANCPTKLWLNGQSVLEYQSPKPVRPDYSGDLPMPVRPGPAAEKRSGEDESRTDVRLSRGWNEVVVKFIREDALDTLEAYFITSYPPMLDGTPDIQHTVFPWEANADSVGHM